MEDTDQQEIINISPRTYIMEISAKSKPQLKMNSPKLKPKAVRKLRRKADVDGVAPEDSYERLIELDATHDTIIKETFPKAYHRLSEYNFSL